MPDLTETDKVRRIDIPVSYEGFDKRALVIQSAHNGLSVDADGTINIEEEQVESVSSTIIANSNDFEILKGLAGRPEEILVSGGILNSPRWTQMLADIFGQEMACVPTLNASTMGAVILALHAAGAIDDVWSFRADYEHATRIQPRPEFQDYYGEQYRQYLDWYSKTL